MFKFSNLNAIHLEISSNCQASCPMCGRNQNGGLSNPLLRVNDWSLADYQQILTAEVLNQIKYLYMCGNYGDPILNKNLLEMCRYTGQAAPGISLAIHTNGSAYSPTWWDELAKALPAEHLVHFAIDGLADTHSLYRIGTLYDKIIDNATAFIKAGGNAEWTFIKFKHNEHQVEECRAKAIELNFKQFVVKDSSRFLIKPSVDVVDRTGAKTHCIEPATDTKLHFISRDMINSYKSLLDEANIECYVKEAKEIYIDADRNIMPCCFLGAVPYAHFDPNVVALPVINKMKDDHASLLAELGNVSALGGIKEVIESEPWQTIWERKWTTDKILTCARTCGKFKSVEISQPTDQLRAKTVI